MNRVKYLLSLFVGILAYVLVSVTVGQNGIKCYKEMEEQKKVISLNASEIEGLNEELKMELQALKSDDDVIASYARKLDYVHEGEKLVKIKGLKPIQNAIYDTGSVVKHTEVVFLDEKYCKMVGVIFFVLTLIIMILNDLNRGNFNSKKNDKTVLKGIPVYNLPQI